MEPRVEAWIRPLALPSIQVIPGESPVASVEPLRLITDLVRGSSTDPIAEIRERYLRLSTQELEILFVPADNLILEKMVWQLKSAKQAFCLADFVGCIALCGMACEMAAVFVFDLATSLRDLGSLDAKAQALFENRAYEKFGQARRIKVLRKLGAISAELASHADKVRELRAEYLHFLSKDYDQLDEDAYVAYVAAFHVIKAVVSLPLGDEGKLAIPSHLSAYLKE